jgi:hypothetical protein
MILAYFGCSTASLGSEKFGFLRPSTVAAAAEAATETERMRTAAQQD